MRYQIMIAGGLLCLTAFLSKAQKGDSSSTLSTKAFAKRDPKAAGRKDSKAAAK